jgi:hypothetical protein
MISKAHLLVLLIAVPFVLSLTPMGWTQPARLSPSCSNTTLLGNYGFLVSGTSVGNPIAIVGQIVADGNGGLTGMETVSDNGAIVNTAPVTGIYKISSKCAGTATITPQGGTAANYNLAAISGGKVQLVRADSGTVQSGVLQAQGVAACSGSIIKGTYGIQQTGNLIGQGPLVFGGQIVLHASGVLSGTRWGSVNGSISSGDVISGAYKIDKRCFGAAVLGINNDSPTHYNLVVVDGGHGVLFLQVDEGTVASGSWQR